VNAGEPVPIVVSVSLNGLEPDEVAVECVLGEESELGEFVPTNAFTFKPAGRTDDGAALYRGDLQASEAERTLEGVEHYQIRLFPWHRLLSHRFEHGCMQWL
jgi:starch phosphorylase